MTRSDFDDLPTRAQVHRIRRVALDALGDYSIEPVRVRLLLHGFNTTFRVDVAGGAKYALRVNVHSRKEPEHLDAELAWLAALSDATDIVVPTPLPTRSGHLRTSAWCEAADRELPVVVMSWLPGRDLDDGTPESISALGATMAKLHGHAAGWAPAPPAAFPEPSTVLFDEPARFDDGHPAIDGVGRDVVARALDLAQTAFDEVVAAGPIHPLHADLHGGNAKWFRHRIAVFDFDDVILGPPWHDLATSVYYLRDQDTLEQDFLAGYAALRPLPTGSADVFEALLAGRNLLLLNDVLSGAIGGLGDGFVDTYARNTIIKLRAFLDSGVYHHDVEGLLPISF